MGRERSGSEGEEITQLSLLSNSEQHQNTEVTCQSPFSKTHNHLTPLVRLAANKLPAETLLVTPLARGGKLYSTVLGEIAPQGYPSRVANPLALTGVAKKGRVVTGKANTSARAKGTEASTVPW